MATKKGYRRADRVAEQLRGELMDMLLRGSVHDPAVSDVVVSAVRMTDDLGIARIYVRVLSEADDPRRESVLAALQRAKGFIRRELGQRVELRYVPALEFHWDEVIDSALRIESILDDLRREESEEPEGST